MTPTLSMDDLKAAQTQMTQAGWTHTCGVMSDSGARTGRYGQHYIKDGREFWLNKDTIGRLPAKDVAEIHQRIADAADKVTLFEIYLYDIVCGYDLRGKGLTTINWSEAAHEVVDTHPEAAALMRTAADRWDQIIDAAA